MFRKIYRLANNCLQHKDLPVYGDGLNIRDWLFVEDDAKAIDMVINRADEMNIKSYLLFCFNEIIYSL